MRSQPGLTTPSLCEECTVSFRAILNTVSFRLGTSWSSINDLYPFASPPGLTSQTSKGSFSLDDLRQFEDPTRRALDRQRSCKSAAPDYRLGRDPAVGQTLLGP